MACESKVISGGDAYAAAVLGAGAIDGNGALVEAEGRSIGEEDIGAGENDAEFFIEEGAGEAGVELSQGL